MWEKISDIQPKDENLTLESHRLKAPGGWIVRSITSRYHAGATVSQTFVSDPNHEWQLQNPS